MAQFINSRFVDKWRRNLNLASIPNMVRFAKYGSHNETKTDSSQNRSVMGGFLTGTTDIFYWALMIFAIGQIKILQYKFKNLGKHALALMDKSKMSSDEAVNHCMKKCIILHQIIIKYVGIISYMRYVVM